MEELEIAEQINELKSKVEALAKQSSDGSQITVSISFLNELAGALDALRSRLKTCAMGNQMHPDSVREDF